MDKKIVFLGTPKIAADFLTELIKNDKNVAGVVTQPDKPFGRDGIITPPPVKVAAMEFGIKTYQPKSSKELDVALKEIGADFAIVVAYGKILKKETLSILPLGFYNVHFSLLPKYRGADPVRAAVLNLEKETGVTIFKIDEGLDSGPILISEKVFIDFNETASGLFSKLSTVGKKIMIDAVNKISSDNYTLKPQEGEASYAKKITVEDTFIDFSQKTEKVYGKIRAFSYDPYSRFYFNYNNKKTIVQIISAFGIRNGFDEYEYGAIAGFEKGKGILVKCLDGAVFIKDIKPQGKKTMNSYDYFINGVKLKIGEKIYE
ncbi:MAG: methionyl-tRNA formyltransferase [Elusimicrobiota bacterium]